MICIYVYPLFLILFLLLRLGEQHGDLRVSVTLPAQSDLWPLTFTQKTFEEQDLQFPERWAFLVSIIILSSVALAAPKALPEAPSSPSSLALQPEPGQVKPGLYLSWPFLRCQY